MTFSERSRWGKPACVFSMFAASVLLVLVSTCVPMTAHSQSELAQVRLGLPFQFVLQDQGRLSPPLPCQAGLASPWEFPTRILGAQLLLDVTVIFALLLLAAGICRAIVRYGWRRVSSLPAR
jgi:hypothetical protein